MANKEKVQMILAIVKGEKIVKGQCPVFEFKDGVFSIENGELKGELVQVGVCEFIPGFEVINLPCSEKDEQEIEAIKSGKPIRKF